MDIVDHIGCEDINEDGENIILRNGLIPIIESGTTKDYTYAIRGYYEDGIMKVTSISLDMVKEG